MFVFIKTSTLIVSGTKQESRGRTVVMQVVWGGGVQV